MALQPSTLVLLPAYNAEKFLGASIESIQAQTCGDWEMIVINDASTDNTGELAAQYAREDSRIRVITNERNRFICYSKNRAAAMTTHEYLLMQDADDVSLPDRLERSLQYLSARPQTAMVGGNHILTDPDGDDCYPVWTLPHDSEDVRELLWSGEYLPLHPTWLVRRSAFEAIGGYDEFFQGCEDHDFLMRIAVVGSIGFLQQPLIRYRSHGGKLSYTRRLRREVEREVSLERGLALREGRDYDLPAQYEQRMAQRLAARPPKIREQYEASYTLAKMYLSTGKVSRARAELWRALAASPLRCSPYLGLVLSLLPRQTLKRVMEARQEQRQPPPGAARA